MQGILFELYSSFKEIRGYAVSTISLGITILVFYIDPQGSVSWKWLILIGSIVIILFIVLIDFAVRSYKNAIAKLPRVKAAKLPPSLYKDAIALLLLEKSILYGQESLVSIYYHDDDFELLIGIGSVITVQRDGLIQVLVTDKLESASEDIWKSIRENNAAALKRLIVKPTVPKLVNPSGV
jgi:hypothetical protein